MPEGQDDSGSQPAPGWYPDPEHPGNRRWWDGLAWSAFSEPIEGGGAGSAPPGSSASATPPPGSSLSPASPSGPPARSAPPGGVPAGSAPAGGPRIDTWLWQSILATIFCCQPLGVVGIAFAAQSQTALNLGSYGLARQKADTARTWTLFSVGIGVAAILGWVLLFVIGVVGASA